MSQGDAVGEEDRQNEHVSIIEYNQNADKIGRESGERVIVSGVQRNRHVPCDEEEGFVKVGDALAIIELHTPITDDEVTDWCNSPAGKLALAHWFEHVDPEEVVLT